MIVVAPPRLRIARVVTVDETGEKRWWDYDDLRREHPELFKGEA